MKKASTKHLEPEAAEARPAFGVQLGALVLGPVRGRAGGRSPPGAGRRRPGDFLLRGARLGASGRARRRGVVGRSRVRCLVGHRVLAVPVGGRIAEATIAERCGAVRPTLPGRASSAGATLRGDAPGPPLVRTRARSPRHCPVAPRAGARGVRRRGCGPSLPRTTRRGHLADRARLPVRRGRAPRRRPGHVRRASGALLRAERRPSLLRPGRAGHVGGRPRRVPRTPRAVSPQRLPPGHPELLHPGASPDVDRRRGARPVGEPGDRRLGLRSGRSLRRGGGCPLARRPRRLRSRGERRSARELRRADVGRHAGESDGTPHRPRGAPPAAARGRGWRPAAVRRARPRCDGTRRHASVPAPAARRGSRGLARLCLGSVPFLDREGTRCPGVPH